jgi:hypothetical protein
MSEASFTVNGRCYVISKAYVFNGQIRVETYHKDGSQTIGKTWLLSDLPPWPIGCGNPTPIEGGRK